MVPAGLAATLTGVVAAFRDKRPMLGLRLPDGIRAIAIDRWHP